MLVAGVLISSYNKRRCEEIGRLGVPLPSGLLCGGSLRAIGLAALALGNCVRGDSCECISDRSGELRGDGAVGAGLCRSGRAPGAQVPGPRAAPAFARELPPHRGGPRDDRLAAQSLGRLRLRRVGSGAGTDIVPFPARNRLGVRMRPAWRHRTIMDISEEPASHRPAARQRRTGSDYGPSSETCWSRAWKDLSRRGGARYLVSAPAWGVRTGERAGDTTTRSPPAALAQQTRRRTWNLLERRVQAQPASSTLEFTKPAVYQDESRSVLCWPARITRERVAEIRRSGSRVQSRAYKQHVEVDGSVAREERR
ncbi:hypothetical protein Q5P01_000319 [Channa striata]|uniref:Uncharacterized protein n=1 Tax=Channa striata TaxID=64152 RepID=A0AA88III6_CHASR|nr:hypothetical protein Q5P01_000319 [Channa striata]